MFIEEKIAQLEKQIKEMAATLEKLSWRKEPEIEDVKVIVEKPAEVKTPEVSSIDYALVKTQINKAAINHRDEIKALNAKFGFKIFADILIDQKDPSKGVKDPAVLEDYYMQLLAIGE